MSNIVRVDQKDIYRTLLTDVLPYELPLWFTNYSMYDALKSNYSVYEAIVGKIPNNYIPLNYCISRGDGKLRELSIIHPHGQLSVCSFYEKYSDLIEYYCSKSNNSLRHPVKKQPNFMENSLHLQNQMLPPV